MPKENIVVIEATSSGANYIHEIKELGYNPICVELHQNEEDKELQRFLHDAQYAMVTDETPDILFADESYEKTLEMIKELNPKLIIPGCDVGVIWANKMSYELRLPANNPKLLKKMMNKRCMQEALKKSDIRYIEGRAIKTFEEAKEFMSETNSSKVVIRPSVGQASIGVCICETDEEIAEAIKLNEGIDVLDNDEILIQEYIGGEEYGLDSVSCNGVNRIVTGYIEKKSELEGGAPIYEYIITVDNNDEVFKEIMEYHKKVIEAIGIENGAIHAEYKVDDKGPALMEVNGRVNGGMQVYSVEAKAWGQSHAGAALEAYLNLDEFHEKLDKDFKRDYYYIKKDIIMPEDCFVTKCHVEDVLGQLESADVIIEFGENRFYPKTVDLSTSAGVIHLTNRNKEKILEDLSVIHRMEREEIEKLFTIKK